MAADPRSLPVDLFGPAEFVHVGLAVPSVREALGGKTEPFPEKGQRVSVAFVDLHGAPIELIEPLGDASPVAASLEKGQKLLHLCFRVPDLDKALARAKQSGFHAISKPAAAEVFGGKRILWLFSKVYGLFELVEA